MTIRDLLNLNAACYAPYTDHIMISRLDRRIILGQIPISEMHPVWLSYVIEEYLIYPLNLTGDSLCVYDIVVTGERVNQEITNIDKLLDKNLAPEDRTTAPIKREDNI